MFRCKTPLPSPKRLRAGRRNPEAHRADRRRVLEVVLHNKPAPCLTRGRIRETEQMGIFQQSAIDQNTSLQDLVLATAHPGIGI
jgi:hypothetical protein